MLSFVGLEVYRDIFGKDFFQITSHVELPLRNHVAFEFRIFRDISDLPDIAGMSKNNITPLYIGVRKSFGMFVCNEVEPWRVVYSETM